MEGDVELVEFGAGEWEVTWAGRRVLEEAEDSGVSMTSCRGKRVFGEEGLIGR